VLIVGYAAGGVTDIPARAFAAEFSKALGVNVVVKNVVGASGVTGSAEVARARPDGYTLLYGPTGPMAMFPNIQQLPYKPEDFIPIFRVMQDYTVLWTHQSTPWNDFASMVEHVRKNPGRYRFATSALNNPAHMANLLLFRELGLEVGHLPANGTVGCIQAMNAGDAHFYGDMTPIGRTYDLIPLGVYSPERLPNFPEIPTFRELGVNPPDTYVWQGVFAPRGTPQAIVDILAAAGERAVNSPELREHFAKFDSIPAFLGPKEFAELYAMEVKRQRDIYIKAGVLKE
jgi:tripartite-type tricarboxylate transporter receptor subunit TctC